MKSTTNRLTINPAKVRKVQKLLGAKTASEAVKTKATPFGPRYEIDGELNTPDGQRPRIRTVWQLDHGQLAPRLITAHPLEANS